MGASKVGNILLDKEILLESGTNELEVLVFRVADFTFGINVAKVREVLPLTGITRLAKSHPSVRGVFKLRDKVVPCVSLIDHLRIPVTGDNHEQFLILADFNHQQTAFLVDAVEQIHRLSWERIMSIPSLLALSDTPVTGVSRIGERLIVMLDFEMVIDQVTHHEFSIDQVENPLGVNRGALRLVLADDSPTVRRAVSNTLRASGYMQLEVFENGRDAWLWLESTVAQMAPGELPADLVISDVEMPQVDGLHLCKKIKEHTSMRSLPVLLYSSIVTPDNFKKGKAVGADAQVSKPELDQVVRLADELISGKAPADQTPDNTTRRPSASVADKSNSPSPTAKPSPAATKGASRDPLLWHSFRQEAGDRAAQLQQLLQAAGNAPSTEHVNQTFRVLHSIKSASMVVPVNEVSRVTHALETVLEATRADRSFWPTEFLDRYTAWLGAVAASGGNPDRVLAESSRIEAELEELVAAAT